jgi:transposase
MDSVEGMMCAKRSASCLHREGARPEVRERAGRLVFDVRQEADGKRGAVAEVADRLGVNRETLRNWVRAAEVERGERDGLTAGECAELKALRKRNAALERGNEILKAASAFFARELDRPQRR